MAHTPYPNPIYRPDNYILRAMGLMFYPDQPDTRGLRTMDDFGDAVFVGGTASGGWSAFQSYQDDFYTCPEWMLKKGQKP